MITITAFKLSFDSHALFSKALNIRLGASVFVAGYRNRMRRGLGVSAAGNLVRHKPLQKAKRTTSRRNRFTPLIDTGQMVKSFRVNRARTTDRVLVMDFPEKERGKALTHQFGDPRRNIAARPHIGASQEDMKKAVRLLEDFWKRNIDNFIRIKRG